VLHVVSDFIQDSLAHVSGGGEEIDIHLLNDTNIEEESEEYFK